MAHGDDVDTNGGADRDAQTAYMVTFHGFDRDHLDGLDGEQVATFYDLCTSARVDTINDILDATDEFDKTDLLKTPHGVLKGVRSAVTLDEFDERGVF